MLTDQAKGLPREKRTSLEFWALVGAALVLSYVPIAHIPFTWAMTFFHEISHGVGALITGGSVEKINLHLTGSGLCYTRGGIQWMVLQAGYVGAVGWGVLIYQMADAMGRRSTNMLALFLAGLVVFSALWYGRDVVTWVILFVLFGLFMSIVKLQEAWLMKLALKFVGIYVLLDAVRAPLHLLDGRNVGDGAALSDLTGIPEIFWVLQWLVIGAGALGYLWHSSKAEA